MPALAHQLNSIRSTQYCGRGAVVGRSPDGRSLRFVPLRCRSWQCSRCAERKAWYWRYLIPEGKPTKWMTLSCNANAFTNPQHALRVFKHAFPALVRAIRKSYGPFEYVAAYERHQNGMPHMHIAFRGSFIAQKWLSYQWKRLAMSPVVHIAAIHNEKMLGYYLTKYMVKGAAHTAHHFLRTRIITTSRHFLPPVASFATPNPYEGWTWVYLEEDPADIAEMLTLYAGCPILQGGPETGLELTCPDRLPPPPQYDLWVQTIWDLLEGRVTTCALTKSPLDFTLPSDSPDPSSKTSHTSTDQQLMSFAHP